MRLEKGTLRLLPPQLVHTVWGSIEQRPYKAQKGSIGLPKTALVSVLVVLLKVLTLTCKYSLDFFGFVEFMLSWLSEFFEGQSLFSRYMRIIARWRRLVGIISTYFELGTRSWGRVMSKKPF